MSRVTDIVPAFVRKSYAIKFTIALLLVFSVIASVGAFTYFQTTTAVDQEVKDRARTTATLEANSVGQWASRLRVTTRTISDNVVLEQTEDEIPLQQELWEMRLRYPNVEAIHLVDTETNKIKATSTAVQERVFPPNSNLSEIDEPWTDSIAVGSDYEDVAVIGSETFVVAELSDKPMLWLTSPVSGREDRKVVVLANVEDAVATGLRDRHDVRVLNREQKTVFTVDDKEIRSTADADEGNYNETLVSQTFDEPTASFEAADGLAQSYVSVGETNWAVVSSREASDAYAVRDTIGQNVLVLAGLGLVSLSIVGVLLGRSTVPPLVTLRRKTNKIGQEKFDVTLETTRSDEIGQLYDEIDEMRENLQSRMQEVKRSREELEQYNEQLDVLDRMLRHNINNQMNVIRLNATRIEAETTGDLADAAEKILETSNSILTRVDKQRKITKTLSGELEQEALNVSDLCQNAVRQVSERHPAAQFELDVPESAIALTPFAVETALAEVVENAIIHTDSETPHVKVSVSQHDDTVTVDVRDDGPGIPQVEREIFDGEREIDPLNHSQGIGLWLVYWTVQLSGGEFHLDTLADGGSKVTLELPAAGETAE